MKVRQTALKAKPRAAPVVVEDVGEEWLEDLSAAGPAPQEEAPSSNSEEPATPAALLYDEPCPRCKQHCFRSGPANLVFPDAVLLVPLQGKVIELLISLAGESPGEFGQWAKPLEVYHPHCWMEAGRPGDIGWKQVGF